MQKIAYLMMTMAVVVGVIASQSIGRAYATAAIVPMPPGATADAAVALNTPYSIGSQGDLYICVSVTRTITDIKLLDPTSTFHNYVGGLSLPITIPANNCLYLNANDFAGLAGGFNMAGDWVLLADIQGGFSFLYEFVVTFNVVPESILGVAAIVAPSLVALTGYRILKQRK
ncbi:MAG: hypothetical protein QXS25_05950 [Candidatus Nitrosocaldus sp.]